MFSFYVGKIFLCLSWCVVLFLCDRKIKCFFYSGADIVRISYSHRNG